MIWWRVDRNLSQQLSLARYFGTLLITAVAVPLFSFALGGIISALFTHKSSFLILLSSAAYLGVFSVVVAWAFLLASVPLFLLARKFGTIGLLTTVIAAVLLSLPVPLYQLLTDQDVTWGNLFSMLAVVAVFAILYSTVVWWVCYRLHPHLFAKMTPTAGP